MKRVTHQRLWYNDSQLRVLKNPNVTIHKTAAKTQRMQGIRTVMKTKLTLVFDFLGSKTWFRLHETLKLRFFQLVFDQDLYLPAVINFRGNLSSLYTKPVRCNFIAKPEFLQRARSQTLPDARIYLDEKKLRDESGLRRRGNHNLLLRFVRVLFLPLFRRLFLLFFIVARRRPKRFLWVHLKGKNMRGKRKMRQLWREKANQWVKITQCSCYFWRKLLPNQISINGAILVAVGSLHHATANRIRPHDTQSRCAITSFTIVTLSCALNGIYIRD